MVFQRDSISVISSGIIGNTLVVHDSQCNLSFAAMAGGSPGKPKNIFNALKAGLPSTGIFGGTYPSLNVSTGRIIVMQPNGLLVILMPMALQQIGQLLQAKEQVAIAEEFKEILKSSSDSKSTIV
jgi:hypothetical protein